MRSLFPAFIVTLAAIIFFGVAMPIINGSDNTYIQKYLLHGSDKGIKTLMTERDRLQAGLATTAELQKISTELQDRVNKISNDDLARLDRYLPDSIDNVQLILDVNSIARSSGMQIKNIKITTDAVVSPDTSTAATTTGAIEPQISTLRMSFAVSGPYESLLSFLDNLSQSLRVLDVETLDFQATPDKNFYQYNVTIKTYWLK
jgi:Tfp pilus assembly protein PilO